MMNMPKLIDSFLKAMLRKWSHVFFGVKDGFLWQPNFFIDLRNDIRVVWSFG